MGPHKLAVHILLILSVFNFLTALAVPVPVQEVREACAEADGGEDLIIMSWKRAEKVDHPWSWHHGLTQTSPRSGSESDYLSTSLQHPPGSPPTTNYASRGYEDSETTNPIRQPASSSGGTELPWYSKGEMPAGRPPYTPGGTELPWYSKGEMPAGTPPYTPGGTNRPSYSPGLGTTSRIPPGSSVRTKTNKWLPSAEIEPVPSSSDEIRRPPYAFGGARLPWYSSEPGSTSKIPQASSVRTKTNKWVPIPDSPQASSVRTKTNKWVATPEIPPASSMVTETDKWAPMSKIETTSSSEWSASSSSGWSSSGEITPVSPNKVLPPSEHITPASSSKVLPSSEEISPVSSNKDLLPSEQITPALSSEVPPPSEHITPGSSSKVLPPSEEVSPASSSKTLSPSEQEGYGAQTPTEQPKPQSGSVLGKSKKFLSKSKNKLVGISKNLVKEMVHNPKLQIRISATASGAVKAT